MQFQKVHVKNEGIDIVTVKTEDHLFIPLNPFSKAIIEKYNYELPKLADGYINRELKDLFKHVEIDEEMLKVKFIGTTRKERLAKKHEIITFHIGRKTFITLSLVRGMPAHEVMKLSGHKDFKTFQKYIRVANQILKEAMSAAWSSPSVPLRKVS